MAQRHMDERGREMEAQIYHYSQLVNQNSSLRWWTRLPQESTFDFEGNLNKVFAAPLLEAQIKPIKERRELLKELEKLDVEGQQLKAANEQLRTAVNSNDAVAG